MVGLNVHDAQQLFADTVHNKLVHAIRDRNVDGTTSYIEHWTILLVRKQGHVYAKLATRKEIFYTVEELKKLHKQLFHLSAESLYELPKNCAGEEFLPDTLQVLQDLVVRFNMCKRT